MSDDYYEFDTSVMRRRRRRGPAAWWRSRSSRTRVALKITASMLALVLVGGLAVGGFYLHTVRSAISAIPREGGLLPTVTDGDREPAPVPANSGDSAPTTFVLIGSDARPGEGGRSDVLMVAYLSGDRENLYLTSFPRDLWVPIPGHGESKINAAYTRGGPSLSVLTLEQLLGVRLDHVAVVDFPGFISLTDRVGGITVNNSQASSDRYGTFPKGRITISGERALAYVRQRKTLQGGDLARNDRQRQVVAALMQKLLSKETLANPSRFSDVAHGVANSVLLDDSLSDDAIWSLARSLRLDGSQDIKMLSAPTGKTGFTDDGQWVFWTDQAAMAELGRCMQTDTMDVCYERFGA